MRLTALSFSAMLLVTSAITAARPAAIDALPGVAPPPAADSYVYVKLTTTLGDMVLELDRAKAPITVDNFIQYAEEGFYEGTVFHRVIPNFMIQGGGFDTEFQQKPTRPAIQNEAKNGLKNVYGSVAMARTNSPHSATAQFFINVVDNAFLDYPGGDGWGYAVFGKVIDGFDTLEKIRNTPTRPEPRVSNMPAPVTPVIIEEVRQVDPSGLAEAIDRARAADEEAAKTAVQEAERQAQKEVRAKKLASEVERQTEIWGEGLGVVAALGGDPDQGVRSETGLWYLDVDVGRGKSPGTTDTVVAHYTGWTVDGEQFDSSRDRGEPATFGLQNVIPGWREALTGMKPGGRRYMFIPAELAYGDRGRPPTIPPRADLVFDVELIDVMSYESFEDALAFVSSKGVDVSSGQYTDSGLWFVDVVQGTGSTPEPTDEVSVHYTGWLNTGKKFDSSRDRGQPSSFGLNRVIPGWTEGVGGMRPGGRRYLVIPSDLAYGDLGRRPKIPAKATLVFDVELLEIKG